MLIYWIFGDFFIGLRGKDNSFKILIGSGLKRCVGSQAL
jgi:hypothetical protein